MNAQTGMAAAMRSTPNGRSLLADAQFRLAVQDALAKSNGSTEAAIGEFLRSARSRDVLRPFFELVAADMAGASLSGGGPVVSCRPALHAAARQQNDDDAGHSEDGILCSVAGASSLSDGGTDHATDASRVANESSPSPLREQAGHSADVAHLKAARPARDPSPVQLRAVDAVKGAAADAIWRTKKTADGRAWGDVGYHELAGLARDGGIAKALIDHIGAVNDKQRFAPLPTLVSAGMFETLCRNVERANV